MSAERKRTTADDPLRARLLAHEPKPIAGIAVSLVVMAALAFIAHLTNAPNPNMILISGLVICAAFFGYPGGITAAVVMTAYTLFFFSTGNDFVSFSEQNMQKVAVSLVGIIVVTFFVSTLRYIVTGAMRQLNKANETLEEENHLLTEISATDPLTGTLNRFALIRDMPKYLGEELSVMMVDLDDFKALNDTYGHATGDFVLQQVGICLSELCAPDHVYRYGGDEFLIMCPCTDVGEFDKRASQLEGRISSIAIEGATGLVHFSGGYVHGTLSGQGDLRLMIRQADANLYDAKNSGKNQIAGCKYSQPQAEALEASHRGPRIHD